MGFYIYETRKEPLVDGSGLEDQLIADGAQEMVHPVYQPYTVCVFAPHDTYKVAAFVYSRNEFWRFFNNTTLKKPARWFVYEGVKELFPPDTIRLHLADVIGPRSFEEIDRREEMAKEESQQ